MPTDADDTLFPFSLPSIGKKKITAAFDAGAGNDRGKNEFRPRIGRGTGVGMSWSSMKERLRSLIFRASTACAILAA
jgi:hypothetical protein